MKSMEKYLRENVDNGAIDHVLRAQVDSNGTVSFYIHPFNVDGDTLDFDVDGNQLFAVQMDNGNGTVTIQHGLYRKDGE